MSHWREIIFLKRVPALDLYQKVSSNGIVKQPTFTLPYKNINKSFVVLLHQDSCGGQTHLHCQTSTEGIIIEVELRGKITKRRT